MSNGEYAVRQFSELNLVDRRIVKDNLRGCGAKICKGFYR
jgi:hypothetical protein